ncbi:putative ABC transport system ATP-binding protein/lipoprotein-releasing system ATP-binding protein [Kaistia hirudinis]|uniref:Putative ABC transport system ATP-binding protein/lipoprotein-releasing system ATP-binding protein n=1 Tax=Kaistia hirudinis TaxID=1293440 RepID=A0A840AUE1_9HYPH|nr:ATP-binding cassette domain-containing protein [Kaistia hirudinis]MBB3932421.1 putative ABC transport system ATP-binding protein/lipoprotein-releasing system ATP-binding protein [Kaistia hirudinis]
MNSAAPHAPLVDAAAVGRIFRRGSADFVAVKAATFQMFAGETIAIIGRSGSGKSSLLHLAAGLDLPSFGSIDWPGLGPRERLRPGKIGMMFQSQSLVPSLDVVENVMLPLALLGVQSDTSDQAIRSLGRFGIKDLVRKLPEELSGGQAQRVSLVRALITRPQLVIADEPTGQLDRASGSALIDALLSWCSETNAALILATHDLEIAARMKRQWRMDHGALTLDNAAATT